MKKSTQKTNQPVQNDSAPPTFRSGVVARMAGMPVSTLRVWEQRYQAVGPITAPSGHRLYSLADVARVSLLRELTQQGHPIGSLAALDVAQLQGLAQTPPSAERTSSATHPVHRAPLRIVVVGQALAQRLGRPSVMGGWAMPPHIVGVFDSLDAACRAAATSSGAPIDLLVWRAAHLQDGAVSDLLAARHAWQAQEMAVAYRFAVPAARDALVIAGASVVRESDDDGALAVWLSSFESSYFSADDAHNEVEIDHRLLTLREGASVLPARRFDDAALTAFAGLSSSVACECPSHLAELLIQIASFESYSASCGSRSLADAELHRYLQRVAGTARLLFETALERVAVAEGLALP